MSLDDAKWIETREDWAERNLEGWKRDSGSVWGSTLCLIHKDSAPSLRVNLQSGGCKCLAGSCGWIGTITEYARLCNLPTEGLPALPAKDANPEKTPPIQYVYSKPDGTPYLRVTRSNGPKGKRFYQNHWDGRTWVKGKVTPSPLFNAPALAKAPAGSVVFLCEGEKCAQHLIDRGLLATTAPEGAGKFGQVGRDWLDLLLPLGVVILPDQDKGGFDHALQAAERLRKELAIESKVLMLPGLGPKEDVADWLQLPRKAVDLQELVPAAFPLDEFRAKAETMFPASKPVPTPPEPKGRKVVLSGVSGQKAEQILEAIQEANDPLKVFIHKPTGKVSDLRGSEIIQCLTPENLAHLCERRMGLAFYATTKEGAEYPTDPPEKPLKRILGMPYQDTGLPTITEFIEAPVLASDGTLITKAGLHPTGIYYRPTAEVPAVPATPSPELVSECVASLDRLTTDFPFEAEEDRQAYLSYLLTGFVAARAPRPWPMWNFSAPCQGSGKGLLASLPGFIAQGRAPGVISIDTSERDPEIRKKLTSLLDSNPGRWQILDNIKGHLSSGALEAFLTSTEWRDRILGGNRMGAWPINVGLALTGNNLTLSPDLERRQILVRLTPDTDKPWLRTDFEFPDLAQHIRENRAQILWQILVLVQRWAALGFPQGSRRLGSFEGWSTALGGLLDCTGIGADFLASTRVPSPTVFDPWITFVQEWTDSHLSHANQPASELCRFVEKAGVTVADGNPAVSLGKKLARQNGRVFKVGSNDTQFLVRLKSEQDHNHKATWTLEKIEPKKNQARIRQNNLPHLPTSRFQHETSVSEPAISRLSPGNLPLSPGYLPVTPLQLMNGSSEAYGNNGEENGRLDNPEPNNHRENGRLHPETGDRKGRLDEAKASDEAENGRSGDRNGISENPIAPEVSAEKIEWPEVLL